MNHAGNATLNFFLGGAFKLGHREMYCCGYEENGNTYSAHWPHTAYVCPRCGERWAVATFSYEFNYVSCVEALWRVEIRKCEGCGDGTLLAADLSGVSEDLLRREVQLLLRGNYDVT